MSCNNPKDVPLFIARSHLTTEGNKTGAWRFLRPRYDEKTAPCAVACPAGEDIGRIQMLSSQGLFKEAWETVLIENPFPGVCGRICRHPCEAACNRGRFDEAVAVHTIERFLADTASRYELKPHLDRLQHKKERIAVAGAGASGLAAAWFLTLMGYGCDVYEAGPEPGGVLRWGVPSYRLPQGVLREEIARIVEPGVLIHCGNAVAAGRMEPPSARPRRRPRTRSSGGPGAQRVKLIAGRSRDCTRLTAPASATIDPPPRGPCVKRDRCAWSRAQDLFCCLGACERDLSFRIVTR